MTLKWFADKLNPELDIIIYEKHDGESVPVSVVKAKDADGSRYAEATIKNFKMCTSRPMARVDI